MMKTFLLLLTLLNISLRAGSFDEIRKQVSDVIAKLPSGTRIGMMIYNPLTEDTLLAINHTQTMIPASNTKLFTTAAALNLMGGDYILSTQILTDDYNISDGVINGNIYIKGLGNPLFTTGDLTMMIDSLTRSGVYKITGDVIGDDTFFDDVYTRDDWIKDEKANVTLPPISALVLDRNRTTVVKKRRGRYRTYFVSVDNPPLFAARKLKEILQENKIIIEGEAKSDVTNPTAKVLFESKLSLREQLQLVNKNSDNFLAECLFKTIGAVASGKQGNSFYATQAILTFIKENGIYSDGTAVVDGSGISRFDQVTVGAIVGLLEKMYFDVNNAEDYYNSLSIAGVDGTLEDRMIGTLAEHNFRGKTGSLNGVSSISGYLTTAGGDDLIISIMFEFKRGGGRTYKNIQDEIISLLAGLQESSPDLKEESPEELLPQRLVKDVE